ncbi:MAG: undecaprenyl-diphosphate phosphatase [Deltaproteobacteria bacterium]|jgi:undecaprenyl-diphosphatase|nr:undecaprenyl-diphosphate phosphatase [Deltaproteobacteria bacterium]
MDSSFWEAVILGLVQGLSEFLPISSSGHLVLVQSLFNIKEPEVFFDLVLHLGTLLAVTYYYRAEVLGLLSETRRFASPRSLPLSYKIRPIFRLGVLIILGSVPTAVIGFIFQDFLSSLFSSLNAVGVNLIFTAAFLIVASFFTRVKYKTELEFPASLAILIGVFQGLAIAPGLSRSGLTISVAIVLGLERVLAARYSFLLSLPAIVGGLILSHPLMGQSHFPPSSLAAGFVAAAALGYLSLRVLNVILVKDRFHYFAPWCLCAGLLCLWLAGSS